MEALADTAVIYVVPFSGKLWADTADIYVVPFSWKLWLIQLYICCTI